MIFRAISKSVRAQAKPSIEDIRRLTPFANQTERLLSSIASNSEIIPVANGPWAPKDEADSMYFLMEGKMRLHLHQQASHQLDGALPAATFPLPMPNKWRLTAQTPLRLLKMPTRYQELAIASQPETKQGNIELSDDDTDVKSYLEFFNDLKKGRYELPVMPDLATRIGSAIDDPDTNNDDIARLIQLDPSLTARVMSVVNSAAYGAREPIRSIQQAVGRLGRQAVRNLVFSCIVKGLFQSDSKALNQRMKTLWAHSTRVAAISFVLAKITPGLDPNRAMLAGLVHDIGAIPILHTARNHPQVIKNSAMLEQIIESQKAEIGSLTLKAWQFEDELSELANYAENWYRIGSAVPDYLDVVLIAQLHAFVGAPKRPPLPFIDKVPAFKKLALGSLSPRHSILVLDNAAKDIEEVEHLLNGA